MVAGFAPSWLYSMSATPLILRILSISVCATASSLASSRPRMAMKIGRYRPSSRCRRSAAGGRGSPFPSPAASGGASCSRRSASGDHPSAVAAFPDADDGLIALDFLELGQRRFDLAHLAVGVVEAGADRRLERSWMKPSSVCGTNSPPIIGISIRLPTNSPGRAARVDLRQAQRQRQHLRVQPCTCSMPTRCAPSGGPATACT
jgi:hypothetical protein